MTRMLIQPRHIGKGTSLINATQIHPRFIHGGILVAFIIACKQIYKNQKLEDVKSVNE